MSTKKGHIHCLEPISKFDENKFLVKNQRKMLKKALSIRSMTLKLPKKFEGTIVERWANYWRGLLRDYRGRKLAKILLFFGLIDIFILDVGIDSYTTIKSNPKKSIVYASFAGLMYSSYRTNPNKMDFRDQLTNIENFIGLVPESSQNPEVISYVKNLNQSISSNTVRITSLGLFSLMWIADHSVEQATFDATCKYLRPEIDTFLTDRVIGFGFWGKWWNLYKMTENYDVNY